MGKVVANTGFWWDILRERKYLENPGAEGRILLRCIVRNWGVGTGSFWLRIGIGGGHLLVL
jgi:hypothetical protein